MKLQRIASGMIVLIATVYILYYLKDMLIPFILAIILWFVIREVQRGIGRISLFGKRVPTGLRSLIAFLLIIGSLTVIVNMLAANIRQIQDVLPDYERKILGLVQTVNGRWSVDLVNEVKEAIASVEMGSMAGKVLDGITAVFGNAFMIIIYVAFLLLEESVFGSKLAALLPDDGRRKENEGIIASIDRSMAKYLVIKTVISLMTGLASYLVLIAIDVDFAFFWAFLIFLLNYIPTVGSLIGTAFPAIIALVQFDTVMPAVWVLILVGTIQVIVGNVLEPRWMGTSLNVSPLVVILSLAFWGSLWGVVGMVLSVPITVMMVIIMAKFPSTRRWAILLSEKGNVGN